MAATLIIFAFCIIALLALVYTVSFSLHESQLDKTETYKLAYWAKHSRR